MEICLDAKITRYYWYENLGINETLNPFNNIIFISFFCSRWFSRRCEWIWSKKIEESFRLPCDEIGNDDCIARALGVGACTWIFGINKDKAPAEALKIADNVLIDILKWNNLDLK